MLNVSVLKIVILNLTRPYWQQDYTYGLKPVPITSPLHSSSPRRLAVLLFRRRVTPAQADKKVGGDTTTVLGDSRRETETETGTERDHVAHHHRSQPARQPIARAS